EISAHAEVRRMRRPPSRVNAIIFQDKQRAFCAVALGDFAQDRRLPSTRFAYKLNKPITRSAVCELLDRSHPVKPDITYRRPNFAKSSTRFRVDGGNVFTQRGLGANWHAFLLQTLH